MAYSCSYSPDYFSIVDILATEERISCKFQVNVPRLGYLDVSSESQDLKSGTKLELPFWAAYDLNVLHGSIVNVDIPKVYKDGYREILNADACAVTLSKWNHFYYELGMHLRKLKNRDCENITECLLQAFKSRFRLIMDWAQNPISDPTLCTQLPRMERLLFLSGKKSKIQLNDWLKWGVGSIESSETAVNLKKRKRTDCELN
ncbi:DNA replication complex GINS protein PSF3 [Prorops nasuta]|uniref:DNA replication complex GINS protein PSF3 n=1 Tax=Prorops nasuta TaxID=863751 RepID=UPI0034CF7BA9